MDKLINYLLQFGNLNKQQIDFITSMSTELTLRKENYFSEAGKIAKQVGFILEGILRVCYYNNNGEEITTYFIDENNFVVDLDSFDNKIPSSGYVQAITDCKLIVFSKQNCQKIINTKDRKKKSFGFRRCHNTLSGVYGEISPARQSYSAFLFGLLPGSYTIFFEQNQEKYPIIYRLIFLVDT